jgi:hypothetical protein
MFTQHMEVPLCGLPVKLVLLSNGTLAFVPWTTFKGVVDSPANPGDVCGLFFPSWFCFFIDEEDGAFEEFSYNTAYDYKEYPQMKRWLIQQNLQL